LEIEFHGHDQYDKFLHLMQEMKGKKILE